MEKQEEKKEVNREENKDIVFIGGKDFMKYLTAVEWQLKEFEKVTIRARGKYTARAIDVSQVLKNRLSYVIDDVKIESEEFMNKENKKVRVSTIDIVIKKGDK
jgi:DNA-binding protein Alba